MTEPGRPFPGVASWVVLGGRRAPDRNGFVTALAVRALRRSDLPVPDEWLDVLAACRSDQGGYGFWSATERPTWAPRLPADADDTAIMTLELWHAGRLGTDEAASIARRMVADHRVARVPQRGPPWLRPGVFGTWFRNAGGMDLVDCAVNANVLALLASLDLRHLPGVAQATGMLAAAVEWAGDDPLRATSLSPFYPEATEFVSALDHAVAAGVDGLADVGRAAAAARWSRVKTVDPEAYAICSSPYGAVQWFAPDLIQLRQRLRQAPS